MNPKFADHQVWLHSHQEECDGLVSMETMDVLSTSQHKNLKNAPKAVPTMCVLTLRPTRTIAQFAPKVASWSSGILRIENGLVPSATPQHCAKTFFNC
jgi:hypothetical protein